MTNENRLRVMFVAGIEPIAQGGAGGQLAVAMQLFYGPLREHCDLVPLSSTQRSSPPPSLPVRAYYAGLRLLRFLRLLPKVDVMVLFASDGFGLIEKGVYCLIGRAAGKGVLIRTGSGRVSGLSKNPFWRWWLKSIFRAANVVCSQGRFWTQYFETFPEAKGKVVETPNGVKIPRESRSAGTRRFIVSYVGRITREKGLFEALEAFVLVHAQHPQARFLIAGEGDQKRQLKEAADKAGLGGSVQFLGWLSREDVDDLLRESGVFLLPSHFEGMPNALLEAMAMGVPVVSTPVGAVRDLVDHDRTGCLVEISDIPGMAEQICRMLANHHLADTLGQQGRLRVMAKHDAEKVWVPFWEAIQRAAVEAGLKAPFHGKGGSFRELEVGYTCPQSQERADKRKASAVDGNS